MAGPVLTVPPRKLTHYLLDLNALDPSKAVFFLSRGFTLADWPQLSDALAIHAFANWPGDVRLADQYGVKHVVTGPLDCPDGSKPDVLAVWQFKPGASAASFITAYPNN